MPKVNIYLLFKGNCEEAFNFYKAAFGGEFTLISRFGEMPAEAGKPVMSDEIAKRIMHVSFPISRQHFGVAFQRR